MSVRHFPYLSDTSDVVRLTGAWGHFAEPVTVNYLLAAEGADVAATIALPHWLAEIICTELRIRRDLRETVRIVHHQSWLIGSPETQREAVRFARLQHTASIARQVADLGRRVW